MNCKLKSGKLCGTTECNDCYNRSFAAHPMAINWSEKNLLKPIDVFIKSNNKYYFNCKECGHELYMMPNKVSNGQWCNYCNSNGLCKKDNCKFCFEKSFASHPRAVNWSCKNEEKPIEVLKNSNKKYAFNCDKCNHELNIALNHISQGGWCKYCNAGVLCDDTKCIQCYKNSFASHFMAICWSPKNELGPREVSKGSDKKYWFKCNNCKHEFNAAAYSIKNDTYCPFCTNQKLCEDDQCMECFNKSCASHKIKEEWSTLNQKSARQTFLQTNKKVWLNCIECGHLKSTSPNKYYNRDGCCPYCANKKLCEDDTCIDCFNKSFASHPRIDCFSKKNNINPRLLFKGSETNCIFTCNKCKLDFNSKLYNILTGSWCPFCKNKTEGKLMEFLQQQYVECKTQLRFDWCRFSETNNYMPIDFGLINEKVLIELDGKQHFNQVSNWTSPEEVQIKDIEKINRCIANGYSIIHINQLDVWHDKYDWKNILINEIEGLKGKQPSLVLISSDNSYNTHINMLEKNINYKYLNPIIGS